jgi:ferredoxin
MTHVVTDNCVQCKFTDYIEVCPVDCFYEVESQLVIDPEECIDCGACEPDCPVEAIYAEDELPESKANALEINEVEAEYSDNNVTEMRASLPAADTRKQELGY